MNLSAQTLVAHYPGPTAYSPFCREAPPGLRVVPMAMMVSVADREHIDAMRARSYELALARGHVRR